MVISNNRQKKQSNFFEKLETKMVVNFHYLLLVILLIYSVSSRNVQSNFNQSNANKKIHLNIHENSYSADDKYKYINECITKCLENNQEKLKKTIFEINKDHCIQTQCRINQ